MACDHDPPNVDYLRLFFADEQEDTAVLLARLFLNHLGNYDQIIRPEDPVEDLIGWDSKPLADIVSFLVALEEQEVFPKEALAGIETFRDLVEYVAARSDSSPNVPVCPPVLSIAHNSFTNL